MLQDLKDLIGTSVIAADGEIGNVRNFLFDDISWEIRYVVVCVGTWLSRREVVLPIAALKYSDQPKKMFEVSMTKEQVRDSPDVDSEKPVSRQQEIAMEEYWGKMAYWLYSQMEGGLPIAGGRTYPVRSQEDADLRSIWGVKGYEVRAPDGEIGRLEGLILDEASWHIAYLEVKAGDWLLGRSVLIPTAWVTNISWPKCRIDLHHSKSGI